MMFLINMSEDIPFAVIKAETDKELLRKLSIALEEELGEKVEIYASPVFPTHWASTAFRVFVDREETWVQIETIKSY
jgi:hypothetical protein